MSDTDNDGHLFRGADELAAKRRPDGLLRLAGPSSGGPPAASPGFPAGDVARPASRRRKRGRYCRGPVSRRGRPVSDVARLLRSRPAPQNPWLNGPPAEPTRPTPPALPDGKGWFIETTQTWWPEPLTQQRAAPPAERYTPMIQQNKQVVGPFYGQPPRSSF